MKSLLMDIKPLRTRIFEANEALMPFLDKYIPAIPESSILVVASKIVALAEGRVRPLCEGQAKVDIIKRESQTAVSTAQVYLTIKDDMIMANAGVDESNAAGQLVLLPTDSFQAAENIRRYFKDKHNLKHLGVIIADSNCLPMRVGVIGIALGYAGFKGVKDYSREADIFGRPFVFSKVDLADGLATAATICMGEGAERQPIAIISQAPVEYCEQIDRNELRMDSQADMYRPLLDEFHKYLDNN